ncbi:MAG: T9SS type A sorting domain-containing protein [Saprospiraceae bacterium]|nr:T9SS type A sorting domain-containing protein [Saprospiraceae bacterium]
MLAFSKTGTNIASSQIPQFSPVRKSQQEQKLKQMNKVLLLSLFALSCFLPSLSNAQVNLKIAPVPGQNGVWGVYTKVCGNASPTGNTITGSGQVTFKFPSGASVANLTSISGTWSQNATVLNPSESVGFTYVSVGFLVDNPQIIYQSNNETLLFTFVLNGSSATPQLLQNGVDPFDHLPNSANSNPGNELTVLDFGTQPLGIYTYVGNFVGNTTSCESEPQDTINTTPIDTTQNGGGDSTVIDTTHGGGDSTVIDTTGQGGGGDTTITNPNDSTQQASGVHGLNGDALHFNFYPTPAFEWLTVEFSDSKNSEGGSVKLFTLNGVLIGEIERGGKGSVKINVSGLPAGLYMLSYERDGEVLQRDKFLKQ